MAIQHRLLRSLLLIGGIALCAGAASADNVHRAIVSRVTPQFPELARRMHVSGKVILLVTIQPDGTVSSTKVESGHGLLAPAAQDAVSHWRFAPNPTVSESEIEVNFNAQ